LTGWFALGLLTLAPRFVVLVLGPLDDFPGTSPQVSVHPPGGQIVIAPLAAFAVASGCHRTGGFISFVRAFQVSFRAFELPFRTPGLPVLAIGIGVLLGRACSRPRWRGILLPGRAIAHFGLLALEPL